MSPPGAIGPAEALPLQGLLAPPEAGIASRVLARAPGGTVTLFAFAQGEELSEHTTPFDAMVVVVDGALDLTIGNARVHATPGTVTRLPANVPHAVLAQGASRMLLIMLRA